MIITNYVLNVNLNLIRYTNIIYRNNYAIMRQAI